MSKVTKKTLASVQQHYVHAREVLDDVLCVQSATSPTRRVYRAVLEIPTLNFLLKAEEEQIALIERYRSLLKSLTFPIQIIVRNERLDLRPYMARVQAQIPQEAQGGVWAGLAWGLGAMLEKLASSRTLIERHCYLVIPAPDLPLFRQRFLRKHKRKAHQAELLARTLQDLSIRVDMVQQQLSALGLRAVRLSGVALANLYYRCLTPECALHHPLLREHLASVGRMPRLAKRRWATAPSIMPPTPPVQQLPDSLEGTGQGAISGAATRKAEKVRRQLGRKDGKRTHPQERASKQQSAGLPPFDLLRFADLLAPGSIEEFRDALCVGDEWVRGIAVTAFPREVSMGAWLAPLLMHDEILEIVFHIHPQPQAQVMRALKRRRTGYASTRGFNRRQGRSDDPDMKVAEDDVTRMMSKLASGDERAFEVSVFLLVRGPDRPTLDERAERVMALLQTVFLDAVAHPTTFEHAQAFRSFLPLCRDELQRTISLDSTSVASTFPFISNSLLMPGGTFLGITTHGEPVLLDPWHSSLENPHAFVGGVTGSGKSYVGKTWLERALLTNGARGERHSVIDPDGEFKDLARAMGGSIVSIATGSNHHLNPFDLVPPGRDLETYLAEVQRIDRLAEKILDLHSLLDLMLADHESTLGSREKALLDRALYETYRRMGISSDPRTHYHRPPLLRDLSEVLTSGVCGPDEFDLSLRLSRYTEGSLAGLFASHTNVQLDSHLLVWDVSEMRGDLRPVGIFLIADCVWTQAVYQSRVQRCLTIDETASLIEHTEGGRFLANLSRRARKRYLRLVVMTQNPETFVEDQWGSVIAANAAIKILKKQDRTSVKAVSQRFGLTQGEEQRLITFGVEEALLIAGDRRVLLSVRANEREHELITTNPVELAAKAADIAEIPEIQEAVTAPLALRPGQGNEHGTPAPRSLIFPEEKEAPSQ